MQKISITLKALVIVLGLLFTLSSCKKDKQEIDLRLDKNTVEMFVDDKVSVNIASGNGGYSASSSSNDIAAATISGQSVSITAKARGTVTITVKDGTGKSALITVTIKSAIIDAATQRFKWTNTIELNKTNSWGTALLSNKIAITNIVERKQYVLLWTGGLTVGDKTAAKLRIVESGKTTEEVALTSLEVQKAENNLYSIIFNKDAQKGELVIAK